MTVGAVDRVAAPIAGLPRLGSDGSMTKRHDSQHSGGLVGDVRSVDRFPPACDGSPLGDSAGMRMKRNDDSQRGDRLAPQDRRPRRRSWPIPPIRSDLVGEADKLLTVTQPVHPTPLLFRTENQLTAPADCLVRQPAHTVAFTTAVAIRGAGSVHRRTGMQTALALPVDSRRRGSPPATDCQQNPPPALPAIQTRCCADHRPAWRCDAGHPVPQEGGEDDTESTARARGVSRGEPG